MKKSADILGLPIISITEGRELGMSKTLVIDAKNGLIAAITIEDEEWYRGVKLIPYTSIIAIGDDAITILHSDKILKLSQVGDYEVMLDENIKILGTKAITKTGTIQGRVSEIFVGEDGTIEKCEIKAADDSISEISADKISIFGKQVTVIDLDGVKKIHQIVKPAERIVPPAVEEVKPVAQPVAEVKTQEENFRPAEEKETVEKNSPVEEIQPVPPTEEIPQIEETVKPVEEDIQPVEEIQPAEEIVDDIEDEEEVDVPDITEFEPEPEIDENSMVPKQKGSTQQAEVLKAALKRAMENQQRPAVVSENKNPAAPKKPGKTVTLVGKKATKTITADNGTVIIEAGAEITEEVLQKARIANKFIELSMSSIA